jgi:DNA repair exonuclease SbcCD nuclease subunit
VKFVHAADLHVDSPMLGLDRYEGAPVGRLRGATRRALENLVTLCIDERASVLLLAGDVFDGSWKDYSTGLFFVGQMTRLREAGVPVVLVRGNHDAASSVVKALRLPDNVKELSSKKAETFELRDAKIAVHGQSFHGRVTKEDLAAGYPDRVPGVFNVGLLHTSLDGREGHEPYAPTSLAELRVRGYDYWALGHVHAREIVATDPYVVFPGNLQGRNVRETGPKGASLVTVEDGVVQTVEHKTLDVCRWEVVTVDASGATDSLEVVDRAVSALAARQADADGRILAARIVARGTTAANGAIRRDGERFVAELRARSLDVCGDGVWLEKVKVETRAPFDLPRLREEQSAVGHLARRFAAMKEDPAELAALAAELAELDRRLPPELRERGGAGANDGLRLDDPATIRALLEDVEQTLLPRLLEGTPDENEKGAR